MVPMLELNYLPESKIKPEDFFSAPEEKILLNWFAYEAALAFEPELRDLATSSPRVKVLHENGIEAVSIALAKGLNDALVRRESIGILGPSSDLPGLDRKKSSRRFNEGYRRHAQPRKFPGEMSLSPQWVANHYPPLAKLPPSPIIANALTRALKGLVRICAGCPVQCLRHMNSPCTMFDDGPY